MLSVRQALIAMSLLIWGDTAVSSAIADSFTYKNARFGAQITLPADLFVKIEPAPTNGDGVTLSHSDGGSIAIYAGHNVLDDTPQSAADNLRAETGENFTITYERVADDWLVQSGFEGEMIFYMRLEFAKDGIVHGFLMKYPESLRSKYDQTIGAISRSLGPSEEEVELAERIYARCPAPEFQLQLAESRMRIGDVDGALRLRALRRVIDSSDGPVPWDEFRDDTEHRLTKLVEAKMRPVKGRRKQGGNGRTRAASSRLSSQRESRPTTASPRKRRKAA